MENAKEFIAGLPFIIFFLIMTLILSMTAGSKITTGFLTLTLLSMVVLNADKVKKLFIKYKF